MEKSNLEIVTYFKLCALLPWRYAFLLPLSYSLSMSMKSRNRLIFATRSMIYSFSFVISEIETWPMVLNGKKEVGKKNSMCHTSCVRCKCIRLGKLVGIWGSSIEDVYLPSSRRCHLQETSRFMALRNMRITSW